MEQNKLSLTTYNCKHCRFTGDKYNFINDLVCNTDFVLLQEICLYPTEFPESAKSSFWKKINILIAEFGKLSPFVISKLFNQYCCSFYGSPLWSISGAAVQALCVEWIHGYTVIS